MQVKVIQWDKSLPEKYDVYDAYKDDKTLFEDAIKNSIEVIREKKKGEMDVFTLEEAINTNVPPQRMIINTILPEKSQVVLGGTEGCNKSFMAMQMAMSIANDEDEFFGFKINVKGLKVLYFDSECGEKRLMRRIQAISSHFNWKTKDRIIFASQRGTLKDIYTKLQEKIKEHNPDVVFIDCLYNTTGGADISKNHNLSPTLSTITDIMTEDDLSILLIAHMNKGEHDKGLVIDRVSGGSAFKNWMEHTILLTKTNEDHLRLMRFEKSRDTGYPNCYYEIEWDYPMMKNVGVSTNWRNLLITSEKKDNWRLILSDLADEFTTNDFKNIVVCQRNMSDKTATNYLSSMVMAGVLMKVKHGHYKKNLELRGEE